MTPSPPCTVHFGGPEEPPRRLSTLLAERIDAVPAGGAIDWVTYYLRDPELAEALVRARRRGVSVRLTLDAGPRTPAANRGVLGLLGGPDGLGEGLRPVTHRPLVRLQWTPRLHEKLYCFSHPEPTAFIGSFNPSGRESETEPEILAEIGDQDRGYNFLVELRDSAVVAGLVEHARRMHAGGHGVLERFGRAANAALRGDGLSVHFWPRCLPNPILRALSRCPAGSAVRIAASHIKGPTAVRALSGLARRGLRVTVLCEETHRRVPPLSVRALRAAGVDIRRVLHPEHVPMHDKFVLAEAPDGRPWVAFGSLNWTGRSLRLNHEIAAICTAAAVFEAFDGRWRRIAAHGVE